MADPEPEGFSRVDLPSGTVTFLLTDIEGSTRLWETAPEAMEEALERHNRLLTGVIEAHGGVVVTSRGEGDSFFACFSRAVSAVEAAGGCQRRLSTEASAAGAALRVRMGLHTGTRRSGDGDYFGRRSTGGPGDVCGARRSGACPRHGGTGPRPPARRRESVALGEHDLAGLSRPERLLPSDGARVGVVVPAAADGSVPGREPRRVGDELRGSRRGAGPAVAELPARLVTLTGVGGVGKTRLALEAAVHLQSRFADGAWLCELAPIRNTAGVDDAVATAMSVRAQASQNTREALMEFLRSRELLLVLDNCEHLLDGAASLARALGRYCERLVILSTSRGLGVGEERLVPVPPLASPESMPTGPRSPSPRRHDCSPNARPRSSPGSRWARRTRPRSPRWCDVSTG